MRQSTLFGRTKREDPKDVQTAAHKFLVRSGCMKQIAAGVYAYQPLLWRSLQKISDIIRQEMDAKDCQEVFLPALQPKELWEESGRWDRYTTVDGIMFAFEDRRGATVCLGPTHEEVITDLVREEVSSYRDLPKRLYQIQTKFRDEIRPRFGLLRAREFIMKDAYSFDLDMAGLNASYQAMSDAYHRICERIGFAYRSVEADAGAIGGEGGSEEFMVLADTGEDLLLFCDSCRYAANQERAESRLEQFEQDQELLPMQDVHGEGLIGVEPLAEFLGIPVWKTTKTLLFQADERVVAVMVRGDCDVNEVKVQNRLGCRSLTLASPETIKSLTGAEVGYAGPLGLPESVEILADFNVAGRVNFECGANRTDYHTINVNFGRDLPLPTLGDFKKAKKGDGCPRCEQGCLDEARGIEVGHIFKLGLKYSEKMNCSYLDAQGISRPAFMGCYGIGVSRIAAAVVEQNHDEKGIIWPPAVAPYQIHLVGLNLEDADTRQYAEAIYSNLRQAGFEILFDDRELRAGEKFADADLIGIPLRVTASKRLLKDQKLEVKQRASAESAVVSYDELLALARELYSESDCSRIP